MAGSAVADSLAVVFSVGLGESWGVVIADAESSVEIDVVDSFAGEDWPPCPHAETVRANTMLAMNASFLFIFILRCVNGLQKVAMPPALHVGCQLNCSPELPDRGSSTVENPALQQAMRRAEQRGGGEGAVDKRLLLEVEAELPGGGGGDDEQPHQDDAGL